MGSGRTLLGPPPLFRRDPFAETARQTARAAPSRRPFGSVATRPCPSHRAVSPWSKLVEGPGRSPRPSLPGVVTLVVSPPSPKPWRRRRQRPSRLATAPEPWPSPRRGGIGAPAAIIRQVFGEGRWVARLDVLPARAGGPDGRSLGQQSSSAWPAGDRRRRAMCCPPPAAPDAPPPRTPLRDSLQRELNTARNGNL
jgi:hypothetical protein